MDEIELKRRMARRRMAWWSFISLFFDMTIIFGGLIFGPVGFGAGLSAASGPIGVIITARVAIILGYLGFSAMEAIKRS